MSESRVVRVEMKIQSVWSVEEVGVVEKGGKTATGGSGSTVDMSDPSVIRMDEKTLKWVKSTLAEMAKVEKYLCGTVELKKLLDGKDHLVETANGEFSRKKPSITLNRSDDFNTGDWVHCVD